MKKKVLSVLITFAMLFSMLPATALAVETGSLPGDGDLEDNNYYEYDSLYSVEDDADLMLLSNEGGPDMSGDIIDVTEDQAQDVLDGAYGDITGKTINFTEDITNVLVLARPTKYAGSKTEYVCGNGNSHSNESKTFDNVTEFLNHFGENEWHATPYYYRTLEGVTFTADEGVTVAGFTYSAGHVYNNGNYDYVRDLAIVQGQIGYYDCASLDGVTFDGLTFTGQFDAKLYQEESTVEDVTFDSCIFLGTADDGSNAAIKFLADNQYFTEIVVKDCEIRNYYQGVYISGVDGAVIENNTISNTEHNAIALQSGGATPAKGDVSVAENYITNVSDRAIRFNEVGDASIAINNNVMVDCGNSSGQLIKAESVADGAEVNLESNYWDGEEASTAVGGMTVPANVGINGGTWSMDISEYLMSGATIVNNGDGTFGIDSAVIGLDGSGTAEDPYLISDLDELKWFRDAVNGGETYAGKYVELTADIDLSSVTDWEPIGTFDGINSSNPSGEARLFDGIFDGGNHTISNLTATGDNCQALFGYAHNVKNLKIVNATITGKNHVAAVVAVGKTNNPNGTVENCHVSGDIQITGETNVGGILGNGYTIIKDCSVKGEDGSFVKGVYAASDYEGDNVGGIVGHFSDGNILMSGCEVENITVSGTRKVGGLIGTTTRQNRVEGCTVSGVTVESTATAEYAEDNASTTTLGGLIGNYFGDGSGGTVTGNTVDDVSFVVGNAKSAGSIVGGDRTNANSEPVGVTVGGNAISDVTGATNSYFFTAVAAVGTMNYDSLQAAIDAAKSGETVTLLGNVTYTGSNRAKIEGKALTIDLGGYTVTGENVPFNIKANADVTLKNGTIRDTTGTACTVQVYSAKATFAEDLTVISDVGSAVTIYGPNAVLTTEAVLIANAENYAVIMGQGNYDGTVINVTGGSITGNNAAIYHPQEGELNISGGVLTGYTGIVMKSGSLNISDGTIKATGDKVEYQYKESGWFCTGDALMIENVGGETGYAAIGTISITGGTFESANADDVGSYTADIGGVEAKTGFVEGGTFSSNNVTNYLAAGYKLAESNGAYSVVIDPEQDVFVAEIDGVGFAALQDAINAAEPGDTVTLLSDVDLTESLVIDKEGTITIDGNGYKITTADVFENTQVAALMLGSSAYGDAEAATHTVNIKNVVFDGVKDTSVIRAQGVTLNMDGCTVQNYSAAQRDTVIRLDYTEATLTNSKFEGNNGGMVVVHNYNVSDAGSQTGLEIDDCEFKDNTVNLNSAVVYYVEGSGCEIKDSDFIGNTVNCSLNAATLYLGFQDNCTVTGNLFQNNSVVCTGTRVRVGGAIMVGYENDITNNAFINNTASNANGALGQICASVYYTDIELSGNYWGGAAPVEGTDYTVEYPDNNDATINSYYTTYADNTLGGLMKKVTFDANGGNFAETGSTEITDFFDVMPERPAKEHYTFAGWFTAADGGVEVTEISEVSTGSIVYAQWTVNQYTITFDTAGGSEIAAITQDYGTAVSAPANPTRSGYTFDGWSPAVPSTMPGEDVTCVAQWTRVSSGGGGGSYNPSYTIAVENTKNGDIAVSPTRASAGSTVTITVDPDTGYVLETLTVLDKNGKKIELTNKGDGKYTFKMPSSKVTVKATFMDDNTMLNFFVDVAADAYYYDAVLWAAKNGITSGTSATTFSPDNACTRAQMATFLWRAAGSPKPAGTNPFVDVPADAYYADAVQWAYENGITAGTSATTFSPDETCTRAQMATFLWREAGSPAVNGDVNPFADVADGAYYEIAVQWAYEQGITAGTSATTFSPDDPCTRAQMVTFLYRHLAE